MLDKKFCCHAEQQGLQLSEGAIYYGLRMLERSGGAMRQHITTENMYEQRLLPEVVSDMTRHSSQTDATGHRCLSAITDAYRLFSHCALAYTVYVGFRRKPKCHAISQPVGE